MRIIVFTVLLAALSTGCQKMLQLEPPSNTVVFETAFGDDLTATATVSGLYARIMGNPQYFSSFGLSLYPALMADELVNVNPSTTYDPFTAARLQSGLTAVNGLWGAGYQYIYHANNTIEGLTKAAHLTDTVRTQLVGEMKFMRAFCYTQLVSLFGDVPLVLSTNYQESSKLPRTAAATVWKQVVSDLLAAVDALPTFYQTSFKSRPNKYAAIALLARVYLYTGRWHEAEDAANRVIVSGVYGLPQLNTVFLNTSSETIWQISTAGLSYNTFEGSAFVPSSATAVPVFAITSQLLNAFETADNRKTAWLGKNTVGTNIYYYPAKYKVRTGSTATEYPIYFRLAEQYLIRAEARAQLDNLAQAKSDLNVIRTRAGLSPTTAVTKDEVLAAIQKERRVELFSEWGHRWQDLKRTGKLDQTLAPLKAGWQPSASLWPVPASQIELNPFLTQNPGY